MKVLVVEDKKIDRMMLSKVLRSSNYDIVEAENGIKALEIISKEKPDIVISDIMMPELDGFSLLREIRKTIPPKELPFIFYSASYVTEKDRELAHALGVSKFIIKPIEPKKLLEEITSILEDFSKGKLEITEPIINDEEILEEYSRRIFNKLEEKIKELEQEIEERKRIEAALSKSETKFRATFEYAPIGIIRSDLEGMVLETNRMFQQMIGYTDDELKLLSIRDFTHPDDLEIDAGNYNEMKTGKRDNVTFKKLYIRKNRTSFWGRLTVSIVRDDAGDPLFVIRMIEDITERKEAEEKLQESEEKYRTLIDNIQDGVFIIQDGKLEFVNETFSRVSGYDFSEIIGEEFIKFVAPEDRERVMDYYIRRQAGEKMPSEYEFNALHKDKKKRITVIINVGLIKYKGRIATMGTLQNITERRKSEMLLRQSKEFSETVLNSISDAISIINVPDFTIIDTNEAFLENYGLKKENVIGKKCFRVTHNIDNPCLDEICPLTETISTGKFSTYEHEHFLKDGSVQYVEVSAYPIKNENGKINRVVHVARDISERKRAEKMKKEKARAELYGFIVSALPVFASGIPSQARDILIKNFSERFEKNFRSGFKKEMEQFLKNENKQVLFEAYMQWLSNLFSNFEIDNVMNVSGKKGTFELITCPWINEARGNPIFCYICRSLTKRSFTWTGMKGSIDQRSSIAGNSKSCRFDVNLHQGKEE